MEVLFSVNGMNMNDEKIVLISLVGILETLKGKKISIDEAEKFLFSPHTITRLRKKNCDKRILDILERGCELEDIASLMPDRLMKTIDDLERMVFELMKEYPRFNKTFWIDG